MLQVAGRPRLVSLAAHDPTWPARLPLGSRLARAARPTDRDSFLCMFFSNVGCGGCHIGSTHAYRLVRDRCDKHFELTGKETIFWQ